VVKWGQEWAEHAGGDFMLVENAGDGTSRYNMNCEGSGLGGADGTKVSQRRQAVMLADKGVEHVGASGLWAAIRHGWVNNGHKHFGSEGS